MKMTKETIVKEDGRLLTYYRFGDAETRRRGDAGNAPCEAETRPEDTSE
jgi:hypothetical protein